MSIPGSRSLKPSSWSCPGTILLQSAQLAPLKKQLSSWRLSPATLRRKLILLLVSSASFFWSLPKAHDCRWGLEWRLTGKLRTLPCSSAFSLPKPSGTTSALLQIPHQTACPCHVPLTWSLSPGAAAQPNRRTMASDLEELTPIPASDLVASCSSAHLRSLTDEANRNPAKLTTVDEYLPPLQIHFVWAKRMKHLYRESKQICILALCAVQLWWTLACETLVKTGNQQTDLCPCHILHCLHAARAGAFVHVWPQPKSWRHDEESESRRKRLVLLFDLREFEFLIEPRLGDNLRVSLIVAGESYFSLHSQCFLVLSEIVANPCLITSIFICAADKCL